MRLPIIPMLILLLVNIAVDCYIYRRTKARERDRRRFLRRRSRRLSKAQACSAVVLAVAAVAIVALPRRSGSDTTLAVTMWALFSYMSIYAGKYLFLIFDALGALPLIWHRRRWRAPSILGTIVAVAVFLAMWWGALINRFAIDVRQVELAVEDLPEAFDGYRIVQFSDLHLGTYGGDTTYVCRVVEAINAQNPDAVMFTGDIVNRRTEELLPFTGTLSRIKAADGVYSVMGNHDYGDYMDWDSEAGKRANVAQMHSLQKEMGWRLLLNETSMLRRGGDSIAVIGVENIGDPPFHIYGSLSKAYPRPGDSRVKILLSHNPAHWVDSIKADESKRIALTLAGHTHAMQMAIGRFSPAALRYKTWGGLYHSRDGKRDLYVNIGIGTVGMPMRIGARPEITVITLKKPHK